MPKEDLLIVLLNLIKAIQKLERLTIIQKQKRPKKIFNELRNNFLKEEIKRIRRKFYVKESTDKYLKKLEEKDREKKIKNVIPRCYKRLKSF